MGAVNARKLAMIVQSMPIARAANPVVIVVVMGLCRALIRAVLMSNVIKPVFQSVYKVVLNIPPVALIVGP